jgi:hypothetical protein
MEKNGTFKTKVEENYSMLIAGRTWVFQKVTFTEIKGHLTINAIVLEELHKAVANKICGEDTSLNVEEFNFLCNLSDSSYTAVSEYLGISKSAISKWVEKDGFLIDLTYSRALKKYFWNLIFSEINRRNCTPAEELKGMSERAVREHAARTVQEKKAA